MRGFGGGDIRTQGSGNIGATNVWRVHGPKLGVPVILVDLAKGFVPALLGSLLVGPLTGVLAGAAAMLGHWRPLFMGFKRGGKIVATTGGAFFGAAPVVGLVGLGVWIVVFALCRYASVASMAAAGSLPLVAAVLGEPWPVIVFAAGAALAVIVLHRANIARLRAGTETKMALRGRRRSAAPAP